MHSRTGILFSDKIIKKKTEIAAKMITKTSYDFRTVWLHSNIAEFYQSHGSSIYRVRSRPSLDAILLLPFTIPRLIKRFGGNITFVRISQPYVGFNHRGIPPVYQCKITLACLLNYHSKNYTHHGITVTHICPSYSPQECTFAQDIHICPSRLPLS